MWEEKLSVLSRGSLSVVSLVTGDIFKVNNDPREILLYIMTLKAIFLMARPYQPIGLTFVQACAERLHYLFLLPTLLTQNLEILWGFFGEEVILALINSSAGSILDWNFSLLFYIKLVYLLTFKKILLKLSINPVSL